jgi:O-antigen/teichoic acid export membrane protein
MARVAGELTTVALVLLSVRGARDVTRAPLATFVGDLVGALLLLWWLRRLGGRQLGGRLAPRLDPAVVRPLVRRAAPLVMGALLGLAVFNADTIFLRVFHDSIAVGYYAAAYTLISFLTNVGIAYSYSLLPAITRLGGPARQALYQTAMAHIFAAAFPATVGGYLLAPQLIELVFGAAYQPAAPALQILIWSIPLATIRDVPVMALIASGREDCVVRTNLWAAACGAVLYVALIPRYALAGAAGATVATEALRLIVAAIYARREGFRVASLGRFWRSGVAGGVMAGVLLTAPSSAVWARVALGALGYLAALALVGGIRFRRRGPPVLDV